jgi:hypothetical protein
MPNRHGQFDAELSRLARVKQSQAPATQTLGDAMVSFFKQSVQKRQTRLGAISEAWQKLVPELLSQHCALESFHRGQLTVIVDTSAHLYDLKQLLLAGLEKQLLIACRSAGLKKISLKRGQWYVGEGADAKLRFDE